MRKQRGKGRGQQPREVQDLMRKRAPNARNHFTRRSRDWLTPVVVWTRLPFYALPVGGVQVLCTDHCGARAHTSHGLTGHLTVHVNCTSRFAGGRHGPTRPTNLVEFAQLRGVSRSPEGSLAQSWPLTLIFPTLFNQRNAIVLDARISCQLTTKTCRHERGERGGEMIALSLPILPTCDETGRFG